MQLDPLIKIVDESIPVGFTSISLTETRYVATTQWYSWKKTEENDRVLTWNVALKRKWPFDDRLRSSTVVPSFQTRFYLLVAKTRWNISVFPEIILCLHHLFSPGHCLFLADEALRREMKRQWKGLFDKYGSRAITAHVMCIYDEAAATIAQVRVK